MRRKLGPWKQALVAAALVVTSALAWAGTALAETAAPLAVEEVELTIEFRDRAGQPATDAHTILFGPDHYFAFVAPEADGIGRVRLPRGSYLADTVVYTPRPGREIPSSSLILQPKLAVDGPTRIVYDARAAKPVQVSVPDPAAAALGVFISFRASMGSGHVTGSQGHPDPDGLFALHSGPAVEPSLLDTAVSAFFARPGPDGTATNSPLVYAGSWSQQGRMYTGFRKRIAESELSTVHARHAATASGRWATKSMSVDLPMGGLGYDIEYTTVPFTRVERYAGDAARWANRFEEYDPDGRANLTQQIQQPTVYAKGRRYHERWNLGPVYADPQVRRNGDILLTRPTLYGDQTGGREGTSAYRRAEVKLYRNGELIGTGDGLDTREFPTVPEPASYRLEVNAERDFTDLAARVSAAWTFTSAHLEPQREYPKLPLPSIRFEPPLDLSNRAPAGRTVPVPVTVDGLRSLTVEASFDGGTTWRTVTVAGGGDRRVALLRHPAGRGSVSLRAKAVTDQGTVEYTVVSAYQTA